MSSITTTTTTIAIFHIISIYLFISSPQLVAGAGRGHGHGHGQVNVNVNVASVAIKTMSLEPKDQDFVTQKRPIFHGKEISGCMPKGRRHSSAPSRYVNNQPLFQSLGCSTVARP
ncbi:unnamed protein product [Lactuca saligna]|uniref:Uncharacterized protein n=1 Tax=Lactuca saligna TaxID=75948 RepID=A0AA36EBE0_LACSI|nr:unnamed protein product [Lactuca saligna]